MMRADGPRVEVPDAGSLKRRHGRDARTDRQDEPAQQPVPTIDFLELFSREEAPFCST